MTQIDRFPDFIIIGAVKAATTWIHAQLADNPGIFMPDPEPHFFSRDFARGPDAYAAWFADARPDQIVGEKSADYLADPQAPARIARMLPDVRLLVQLRNPVERAYSDYKMLYRRGTVRGGPEEYLGTAGGAHPRFLDDGLYAQSLARWFDHFDPARIGVLLFEDVKADPQGSVRLACDHIAAPFHFNDALAGQPVNDSSARILPLPLRSALSVLKRPVAPLRGTPLLEGVRGLFARETRYPPMTPDLRAQLADFYADDVARLSTMIGRPLDHWLDERRQAA